MADPWTEENACHSVPSMPPSGFTAPALLELHTPMATPPGNGTPASPLTQPGNSSPQSYIGPVGASTPPMAQSITKTPVSLGMQAGVATKSSDIRRSVPTPGALNSPLIRETEYSIVRESLNMSGRITRSMSRTKVNAQGKANNDNQPSVSDMFQVIRTDIARTSKNGKST